MQLVRFEAFRDLIKLLQLELNEDMSGILLAEDENIELRASARSSAVGQYNLQAGQASGPNPGASGTGAPLETMPSRGNAGNFSFPAMNHCLFKDLFETAVSAIHACTETQCQLYSDCFPD